MEVIILCGGFGTRLNSVIKDIPKSMALINDKPFLYYVLDDLNNQGIEKVVLAVGYKKEIIINYFGDKFKNIKIEYSEEMSPLGTGGAIKKAMDKCTTDNVIVMNGDIYIKLNYKDLYSNHINSGKSVTLAIKQMEKFDRYGSVCLIKNEIIDFNEKTFVEKGYMSVGCYVLKKDNFRKYENNSNFSIEKDFFKPKVKEYPFNAYLYKSIFIDIGIPSDYELAKKEIIL